MAIVQVFGPTAHFIGLSGDTKPTDSSVLAGARFVESDTGDQYEYDGVAWFAVSDEDEVAGAVSDATTHSTLADIETDIDKLSDSTFLNITLAAPTTTVVKASPGHLGRVVINKPLANGVITLYDHGSAAGTVIGTITFPAALLSTGPITVVYELEFATALTVVTSGAAMDITVVYS